MNLDQLRTALAAACDAMRRSDPVYCAAMGLAPVTDAQWDNALAAVEDALDAESE